MKLFLSLLIGLGLTAAAQAADAKRKVAQAKMTCVPLGISLNLGYETDELTYTADELAMLRNSIFAQMGFKFQTPHIAVEMERRGCLNKDVTYSADKLQEVDKTNVSRLKAMEEALRESEVAMDFEGAWNKTSKSRERAKLLVGNYCYLSDVAGKYFGIIYFDSNKQLSGMMNLNKPSWAETLTDKEKAFYNNSVAYKELDTTSAVLLDYATKGSWLVADSGKAQVTINSSHKNVKNAVVNITSAHYKNSRMLDCQLAR